MITPPLTFLTKHNWTRGNLIELIGVCLFSYCLILTKKPVIGKARPSRSTHFKVPAPAAVDTVHNRFKSIESTRKLLNSMIFMLFGANWQRLSISYCESSSFKHRDNIITVGVHSLWWGVVSLQRRYNATTTPRDAAEALWIRWMKKTTLLQRFYNASTTLLQLLQRFCTTVGKYATLLQRFCNASTALLQRFYNASATLQKPKIDNASTTLLQRFYNVSTTLQKPKKQRFYNASLGETTPLWCNFKQ